MKIYRVVVRGQFTDLTDAQRKSLNESAAEHDYLSSAFTANGTLIYTLPLASFNFRYEVRDDTDTHSEEVGTASVARAQARLDEMGLGYKRMRAEVTDMASIWD